MHDIGVSETCFRDSPKRDADNDEIADLLLKFVKVKKSSGFGLKSMHMRMSRAIAGTTNVSSTSTGSLGRTSGSSPGGN